MMHTYKSTKAVRMTLIKPWRVTTFVASLVLILLVGVLGVTDAFALPDGLVIFFSIASLASSYSNDMLDVR